VEIPAGDQWALADPQLAVELLGTLRHEHDTLIDDLADEPHATAWLRDRLPETSNAKSRDHAWLVGLRELIREVLAAAVDGEPLPAGNVEQISEIAARAPVTLAARIQGDGSVIVERASRGAAELVLGGEIARSALALLHSPGRLRRCRAPGCILFFLQHDSRQQWCSPSCGNRARVARHYARRTHQ
jgi:predicted RNA-binding Zn ribbon-like protein